MSEDTRESATVGESLLPKKSPTELKDVSAGLDDTQDEKKALALSEIKVEVKFAAADSQNGDAILDIENVRQAFSGMGKEELMKFANDPFWVRTRWVLFVSFWVLWVAMVAGAIAIIVLAPKCAPPKPRRWWEQSPLYTVDSLTSSGKNLGKIEGIESYLSRLSKAGADGVILPPLMNTGSSNDPEAVIDFKAIRPDLGSLDDFKKAIKNLTTAGVHVVLEIAPGQTSKEHEWFKKSVEKADRYKDYYIWVNSSQMDLLTPDKAVCVPDRRVPDVELGNDWKQSAFIWNEQRGAFYLRQSSTDLPLLNLTNPDVLAEFREILKFWLDQGISGFQVRHASSFFANSLLNPPEGRLDEHDPLSTIEEWRTAITNHTHDSVLILQGDLSFINHTAARLGDILRSPLSLFTLPDGFTAEDLKNKIEQPVSESATKWPVWEISDSSESASLPPGLVDGLLITSMLLPGTPVFHDDSLFDLSKLTETGVGAGETQIKSPSQHRAEIFKEISSVRKNMVAVSFGSTNVTLVTGTDNVVVFTVTRIKSGNPGILVVVNPSSQKTTVDLTGLEKVPEELTVNSVSYRSDGENTMQQKSKPPSNGINMPEKSAVVFTFVPKKES